MYKNAIDKIKDGEAVFFAVYGTLKRGRGNHRVMGEGKFITTATVQGYDMYSLGGFPGIKPGKGSIEVEIFSVDRVEDASRIYSLEGYPGKRGVGRFYDTEDIKFELNGIEQTAEIFIYQGSVNESRRVESGVW